METRSLLRLRNTIATLLILAALVGINLITSPTTFAQTTKHSASTGVGPNSQPGTVICLKVQFTVENTQGYGYHIKLIIINDSCGVPVHNVSWAVNGTISCAGQSGPGIQVSGSGLNLANPDAVKVLDEDRVSDCILNNSELLPNSQIFSASANGTLFGGPNDGKVSVAGGVGTLDFPTGVKKQGKVSVAGGVGTLDFPTGVK